MEQDRDSTTPDTQFVQATSTPEQMDQQWAWLQQQWGDKPIT